MKHHIKSLIGLSCALVVATTTACSAKGTAKTREKKMDSIVLNKKNASPFNKGKFQGWGTSFCWWANRIGYDDELAKKAAELFYTEEGLGLNIIRYNVGGGDDPTHKHITRTDSNMPGFMVKDEDGNLVYDWNQDHNQRNVLKECVKACGQDVIVEAFSNSPPYFMTNSGCSTGAEDASKDNLREDQYEAFAEYMATVMENLQKIDGVTFQSCDPMNEPATSYWGAYSWKQEGCHFDLGTSQSKILVEMQKALKAHGLKKVILCGTDETNIDTAALAYKMLSKDAKKAITRIDTHSYMGTLRDSLRELAVAEKKNLWMSEVDGGDCLGQDAGEMGCPLWLSKRIMDDMNGLLPSAWILWQVVDNHISTEGYNGNKDYGMPNTQYGYWGLAVCDHDNKDIILTKKFYAMAQFSKFIRPGSTIITSSKRSLAAYDKNRNQVIVVCMNDEKEEKDMKFDLSSFKKSGDTVRVYRTSGTLKDGENCARLQDTQISENTLNAHLLGNSITTFVIENVL